MAFFPFSFLFFSEIQLYTNFDTYVVMIHMLLQTIIIISKALHSANDNGERVNVTAWPLLTTVMNFSEACADVIE